MWFGGTKLFFFFFDFLALTQNKRIWQLLDQFLTGLDCRHIYINNILAALRARNLRPFAESFSNKKLPWIVNTQWPFFYFIDGDLLDALTGDEDHLDVIIVHGHDDNLSIELKSNFYFHDSLQSKRNY